MFTFSFRVTLLPKAISLFRYMPHCFLCARVFGKLHLHVAVICARVNIRCMQYEFRHEQAISFASEDMVELLQTISKDLESC